MTTNTIETVFSARLAESIAPALEGMKLWEQVARAAAPHALATTQALSSASAAAVGLMGAEPEAVGAGGEACCALVERVAPELGPRRPGDQSAGPGQPVTQGFCRSRIRYAATRP